MIVSIILCSKCTAFSVIQVRIVLQDLVPIRIHISIIAWSIIGLGLRISSADKYLLLCPMHQSHKNVKMNFLEYYLLSEIDYCTCSSATPTQKKLYAHSLPYRCYDILWSIVRFSVCLILFISLFWYFHYCYGIIFHMSSNILVQNILGASDWLKNYKL